MSTFSLQREMRDGVAVITLKGQLDAHTASQLEAEIASVIADGTVRIVCTFSQLEYISSAGLGVFMEFIEDVKDKGGNIVLAEMSEKIYTVFDLLGFPMLFDIVPTREDAFSTFA